MTRSVRSSTQSGMTLVEVLMVIFIIGLTTGLAVLTVPDRRPSSDTVARQFLDMIEETRNQAIYTGQPIGLVVEEGAFDLAVWRDPAWIARGRPQALPDRVDVVIMHNEVIARPDSWPDLVFDPTGLVDPVTITISGARLDVRLTIDSGGEVTYDQS